MNLKRYNSARLFAQSRTAEGSLNPISLITDVEFGFDVDRSRVKSVGYKFVEDHINANPRPFIRFSYYLSDVDNEKLFRMPVTSEESVQDGKPMFSYMESFDLFFATIPDLYDFNKFTQLKRGDDLIEMCAFSNAVMQNYNMAITASGLIKINVEFSADDLIFKTFKNIEKYNFLDFDNEDIEITNENYLIINPGDESEINLGMGGFTMRDIVTNFNFSAPLNYKILYDFGQQFHSRKLIFPIYANISLEAVVRKSIHGQISELLCNDRLSDFAVTNARKSCETLERSPNDQKSGLIFKGAKIRNQSYRMTSSRGDLLKTSIDFDLEITRNYGAWMSQHIAQVDNVFEGEAFDVLNILLEFPDGEVGILSEAALDMLGTLKKFSNSVTKN